MAPGAVPSSVSDPCCLLISFPYCLGGMLEPTTVDMWTGYGLFDAATWPGRFHPGSAITAAAADPGQHQQREQTDERYRAEGRRSAVPACPRRAFRARFG